MADPDMLSELDRLRHEVDTLRVALREMSASAHHHARQAGAAAEDLRTLKRQITHASVTGPAASV